jgi:hypothetical protein
MKDHSLQTPVGYQKIAASPQNKPGNILSLRYFHKLGYL